MKTVSAEFLKITIDLGELSEVLVRALGHRYQLSPLGIKCTYPVFRGEAEGTAPIFVKVGVAEEWRRTTHLLAEIGDCGLFARMLVAEPLEYRGAAVFAMEWRNSVSIRPEDLTMAQADRFVKSCVWLSEAMQLASDVIPLADSPMAPERLYEKVADYARRHPLAGRLIADLVAIPERQRTFGNRKLSVVHGDFHWKNYGLAESGEISAVFDFDKLTQGLACGDLANALVERFSCLSLSAAARRRLGVVARHVVATSPWPRDDFRACCNHLRLAFAARRIDKHPDSAWVAIDIWRRDRKIREFLEYIDS